MTTLHDIDTLADLRINGEPETLTVPEQFLSLLESLPKDKRVKFVSLFFLYANTNFVPQAMAEAFKEVLI